jgi:PTH2 family peptidyl-tRNA hydrolase
LSKPDPNEIVMYLVARRDLNMSHGKFGAQCGHGVQLCIREAESADVSLEGGYPALAEWEDKDYPKIVLAGDEKKMSKLLRQLGESSFPHAKVVDRGRTELPPDTLTLVALGPMKRSDAEPFVGRLQAYPRA